MWRLGNPITASNGIVTGIAWTVLQRRTIKGKKNYTADIIVALNEYFDRNNLNYLTMFDGIDIAARWLQLNSKEM